MRFAEKKLTLRNGMDCCLRSPEPADAEAMLCYLKKTSGETDFMARYEEEVTFSVEDERAFLESQIADKKSLMIAAVADGKIIANAGIHSAAPFFKYRHRAEFGISIIKQYWNMGIGSVILSEIISHARFMGYEQIELEVVTDNVRAIDLYMKHGFVIYGTRERAFKYKDGTYGSEYLMMLTLRA